MRGEGGGARDRRKRRWKVTHHTAPIQISQQEALQHTMAQHRLQTMSPFGRGPDGRQTVGTLGDLYMHTCSHLWCLGMIPTPVELIHTHTHTRTHTHTHTHTHYSLHTGSY